MNGQDDQTGQFLPGNRLWDARSSRGRKPHFTDPEDLREACIEYFEFVTDNPLQEEKLFSFEGSVTRARTAKMQAMTIKGLQIFLDISQQSWSDYANKPEFQEVCEWVKSVIFTQKFTGAAAGLLSQAIIAQELGLANKLEHSGPGGGAIQTEEVSARDRIASRIARLSARDGAPADTGEPE